MGFARAATTKFLLRGLRCFIPLLVHNHVQQRGKKKELQSPAMAASVLGPTGAELVIKHAALLPHSFSSAGWWRVVDGREGIRDHGLGASAFVRTKEQVWSRCDALEGKCELPY